MGGRKEEGEKGKEEGGRWMGKIDKVIKASQEKLNGRRGRETEDERKPELIKIKETKRTKR